MAGSATVAIDTILFSTAKQKKIFGTDDAKKDCTKDPFFSSWPL
jgi:hypothetical protein